MTFKKILSVSSELLTKLLVLFLSTLSKGTYICISDINSFLMANPHGVVEIFASSRDISEISAPNLIYGTFRIFLHSWLSICSMFQRKIAIGCNTTELPYRVYTTINF